jgi:hypothetical protein
MVLTSLLVSLPLSLLLLIFPCHQVTPCLALGHPNGGAHNVVDHMEPHDRHTDGMALVQDFSGRNHWVYWNHKQHEKPNAEEKREPDPRMAPQRPNMANHPKPNNTSGPLYDRAVQNLQSFKQALGGLPAPSITMSNDMSRPFSVMGDTFVCQSSAVVPGLPFTNL